MKLGIFGGTFDPIHNAHLTVARESARHCGLERVLLIPAANPPHKTGARAPYEDRLRMVKIACGGDPVLEASGVEAGEEKSYSFHTIEKLRAGRGPGDRLYFIIGADAFSEISTWFRWEDVVRAVEFIVVARPGATYAAPDGAKVHRLDTLALFVSSSDVRHELAEGRAPDVLPEAVLRYIRDHRLYVHAPAKG